jgi:hypothetical protein
MRKFFFVAIVLFVSLGTTAQEGNPIFVGEQDFTANSKEATVLCYWFAKGDKIILNFSTNKDRELNRLYIFTSKRETLFDQSDLRSQTITIVNSGEDQFINFAFYGPSLGRQVNAKIERVPDSSEKEFFSTNRQLLKEYKREVFTYEIDSVVGMAPVERTPVKFEVFEDSYFVQEKLEEKKYKINGGGNRRFSVNAPADRTWIQDGDTKRLFACYQVVITAGAADNKFWKYAKLGVDIGTLGLNLAFPIAGTVAGIGINAAFDMYAPQPGGEPILFILSTEKESIDKFLENKGGYMYQDRGLVTAYSGTFEPFDALHLALRNLNISTQVEVTVGIYAVYQVVEMQKIEQDELLARPHSVKIQKQQERTKNVKRWSEH